MAVMNELIQIVDMKMDIMGCYMNESIQIADRKMDVMGCYE